MDEVLSLLMTMWKKIKAFLKGKRFRVTYILSITSYIDGELYNYVVTASTLKEAQLYMNGDFEVAYKQLEEKEGADLILHDYYIHDWSASMKCEKLNLMFKWRIYEKGIEL